MSFLLRRSGCSKLAEVHCHGCHLLLGILSRGLLVLILVGQKLQVVADHLKWRFAFLQLLPLEPGLGVVVDEHPDCEGSLALVHDLPELVGVNSVHKLVNELENFLASFCKILALHEGDAPDVRKDRVS